MSYERYVHFWSRIRHIQRRKSFIFTKKRYMENKADRTRCYWKRQPELIKKASTSEDLAFMTCFIRLAL